DRSRPPPGGRRCPLLAFRGPVREVPLSRRGESAPGFFFCEAGPVETGTPSMSHRSVRELCRSAGLDRPRLWLYGTRPSCSPSPLADFHALHPHAVAVQPEKKPALVGADGDGVRGGT